MLHQVLPFTENVFELHESAVRTFGRLLNTLQLPITMVENLVNWQLWFL